MLWIVSVITIIFFDGCLFYQLWGWSVGAMVYIRSLHEIQILFRVKNWSHFFFVFSGFFYLFLHHMQIYLICTDSHICSSSAFVTFNFMAWYARWSSSANRPEAWCRALITTQHFRFSQNSARAFEIETFCNLKWLWPPLRLLMIGVWNAQPRLLLLFELLHHL